MTLRDVARRIASSSWPWSNSMEERARNRSCSSNFSIKRWVFDPDMVFSQAYRAFRKLNGCCFNVPANPIGKQRFRDPGEKPTTNPPVSGIVSCLGLSSCPQPNHDYRPLHVSSSHPGNQNPKTSCHSCFSGLADDSRNPPLPPHAWHAIAAELGLAK